MKTILWATLTANGNYAQSIPEESPEEGSTGRLCDSMFKQPVILLSEDARSRHASSERRRGSICRLDIVVVSRQLE